MQVRGLFRRVSLGVAHHGQAGVVRHHDGLAPILGFFDALDQHLENGLVAQVLLGLVDDDRYVVLVHQQVEDQQDPPATRPASDAVDQLPAQPLPALHSAR